MAYPTPGKVHDRAAPGTFLTQMKKYPDRIVIEDR